MPIKWDEQHGTEWFSDIQNLGPPWPLLLPGAYSVNWHLHVNARRASDDATNGKVRNLIYGWLIQSFTIQPRLRVFGVDEAHLYLSWGKCARSAFNDLGFNRDRIPISVPPILVTTTLTAGRDTSGILHLLNLRWGNIFLYAVQISCLVSSFTFFFGC